MEEGSEPAGTGLSAFCQGKVAAEGFWQGLVLMAGTHRVLRLGTEPRQHTGEPRGEFCCTRGQESDRGRSTRDRRWQSHPTPPAGTGDPAGTYSSRSSSGRWELGRREGRAGKKREETQLLLRGAAVPPGAGASGDRASQPH